MGLLIAGLVLWSAVHLFSALAAPQRQRLLDRFGRGPYRGVYSLLLVGAILLMVAGWRAAALSDVYLPPPALRLLAGVLMFIALTLFFSSRAPTDIKRFLRHPQLTGVVVWAIAHLLANGDSRSLLLFGALGAWAVVEMSAINRRDGEWVKPPPVGALRSALPLAIGALAWIALVYAHPWIAGVPAFVRG
jgi:uncharacterized membrane protein